MIIFWSYEIEAFLNGKDYFRFVVGSYPRPTSESECIAWLRANKTLVSIISATFSECLLATVIGCSTSQELWAIFKTHLSHKSFANASLYRKSLTSLNRRTRSITDSGRQVHC